MLAFLLWWCDILVALSVLVVGIVSLVLHVPLMVYVGSGSFSGSGSSIWGDNKDCLYLSSLVILCSLLFLAESFDSFNIALSLSLPHIWWWFCRRANYFRWFQRRENCYVETIVIYKGYYWLNVCLDGKKLPLL